LKDVSDLAMKDGKLDLRRILGESTQEIRGLENMCCNSILHPEKLFRKVNGEGLMLCSFGLIKDVYVEDSMVCLMLKDKGYDPRHCYVCNVPEEYRDGKVYEFVKE